MKMFQVFSQGIANRWKVTWIIGGAILVFSLNASAKENTRPLLDILAELAGSAGLTLRAENYFPGRFMAKPDDNLPGRLEDRFRQLVTLTAPLDTFQNALVILSAMSGGFHWERHDGVVHIIAPRARTALPAYPLDQLLVDFHFSGNLLQFLRELRRRSPGFNYMLMMESGGEAFKHPIVILDLQRSTVREALHLFVKKAGKYWWESASTYGRDQSCVVSIHLVNMATEDYDWEYIKKNKGAPPPVTPPSSK